VCVNDAVIAHYAATGGVGVLIISGTGSAAFGRNAAGEEARCGGWPPVIFGDEGSGVWIGYMALNHLGQVFDGRRPPSRFSERLQKTLGISGGEGLIAVCIEIEHMRWADPGLSAEVNVAAGEGDEHAVSILREAAHHTFALGDSIVRRLGFDKKEEAFRVGVWGSAITKSPLHFACLKESFEMKHPTAEVLVSDKDASEGACGMALHILHGGE
jgi:N-acetylglucosamine kinase-like BadF-type ATPase